MPKIETFDTPRPAYPLGNVIRYYVEEYNSDDPGVVNHAWMFDNKKEAEDMLLTLVQANGDKASYSAYFVVNEN